MDSVAFPGDDWRIGGWRRNERRRRRGEEGGRGGKRGRNVEKLMIFGRVDEEKDEEDDLRGKKSEM